MRERLDGSLGIDEIRQAAQQVRGELEQSLETDRWEVLFKGRNILSVFAGRYANGMRYEYFRDLIVSLMVNASYQPEGMKRILDRIASD